jgi:phage terminase small subunit
MDRTNAQPAKLGPKSRAEALAAIAKGKVNPAPIKKRGASALETHQSKNVRQYVSASSAENAALIDPNKPLTLQQREFAKLWASGETIKTATVRAGYADESFGYRMARMPNVLRVYQQEKAAYEAASQMTRKRVMDGLLEAVEMAKLMAEPATMVSGWREIGRMCGYYEPVKHTLDINIKGDVTLRQLNGMTDAELLKALHSEAPLALPNLDEVDDVKE